MTTFHQTSKLTLICLILFSSGCSTAHFTKYSVDTHREDGITFITYEYVPNHLLTDRSELTEEAKQECEKYDKKAYLYGGGPIIFSFGTKKRIYFCANRSDLLKMSRNPDHDHNLAVPDLPEKAIRRIYERNRDDEYVLEDIVSLKKTPHEIRRDIFEKYSDQKLSPQVRGVLRGLASNEDLSEKTALRLAGTKDYLIAADLIHNSSTPVKILKKIKHFAEEGELEERSGRINVDEWGDQLIEQAENAINTRK